MNWKKRKKLNRLAKRHGLIHGYEYKRFIREKVIKIRYKNRNGRRYSPEVMSTAIADFEKRHDRLIKEGKWRGELNHPTDTVNVDVTVQAFNKPNRMKRQYDPNGISDAITDGVLRIVEGKSTPTKRDTRVKELMKYRGKLADIESEYRITGGEAIEYPNSAVIDLRNVAITPRMNISPEGEVKIVGFGLEKKEEASEAG